MILVFAGAGASRAVDPENYPTTVEFFQKLSPHLKQDTLFANAFSFLQSQGRKDDQADIEQVLWVLEELAQFCKTVNDTKTVAGWFLHASRLVAHQGPQARIDLTSLTQSTSQMVNLVRDLTHRINVRVYDLYSQEPAPSDLEKTWLPLLRTLLGSGERIEVFTTNYDLVIEVAAHKLFTEEGLPKLETGRTSHFNPQLDLSNWTKPPASKSRDSSRAGLITKLHGSVDWSKVGDRIFAGEPGYKGTHDRHVILYPGFKGSPDREPFITFHNYLLSGLSDATAIIFIGFSFRDSYINDLLRFTNSKAKIIVLNPREIKNVPFNPKRVTSLVEGFGKESLPKLIKAIGLDLTGRQIEEAIR